MSNAGLMCNRHAASHEHKNKSSGKKTMCTIDLDYLSVNRSNDEVLDILKVLKAGMFGEKFDDVSLSEMEATIRDLEASVVKAEVERDDAVRRAANAVKDAHALRRNVHRSHQDREKLSGQLTDTLKREESARASVNVLKEEVLHAEMSLKDCDEVKTRLVATEARAREAGVEAQRARKNAERLEVELQQTEFVADAGVVVKQMELDDLSERLAYANKSVERLLLDSNEAERRHEGALAEIERLQADVQRARENAGRLEVELQQTEFAASWGAIAANELDEANENIAELEARIVAAHRREADARAVILRIDEEAQEYARRLLAEVQHVRPVEEQTSAAEMEGVEREGETEGLRSGFDSLNDAMIRVREERDLGLRNVQRLETQLREAREEAGRLNTEQRAMQSEVHDLEQQVARTENELRETADQLQRSDMSREDLTQQLLAVHWREARASVTSARNARLQGNEIDRLEEQLARSENELRRIETQLESFVQREANENTELSAELTSAREEVLSLYEELRNTRGALQEQMSARRVADELAATSASVMQREVHDLEQQVRHIHELERHRQDSDVHESLERGEFINMQRRINDLTEELRTSQRVVDVLDETLQSSTGFSRDLHARLTDAFAVYNTAVNATQGAQGTQQHAALELLHQQLARIMADLHVYNELAQARQDADDRSSNNTPALSLAPSLEGLGYMPYVHRSTRSDRSTMPRTSMSDTPPTRMPATPRASTSGTPPTPATVPASSPP